MRITISGDYELILCGRQMCKLFKHLTHEARMSKMVEMGALLCTLEIILEISVSYIDFYN